MWVRGGLWGLHTRRAALAFFWFSAALGIACAAYGFSEPLFFWGGAFVLSAAWYWSSIRWVDRHGEWSRPSD